MHFLARRLKPFYDDVFTIDVGLSFSTIDDAVDRLLEQVLKMDFYQANFIGHSTGGIVVRHLLNREATLAKKTCSVILLGVPSRGTPLADLHQKYIPKSIRGIHPLIVELTKTHYFSSDLTRFPDSIAVGGIAGIQSWESTRAFFTDLNDGVVEYSSVWLPEMKDMVAFPLDHQELTQNEKVVKSILYFFENQHFPIHLYRLQNMNIEDKFAYLYQHYVFDDFFDVLKNPNIEIATMGGKVFWKSLKEIEGWKLQQNKTTGHLRVLNPSNIRKAWGSKSHLEQAMDIVMSRVATDQPWSGKS